MHKKKMKTSERNLLVSALTIAALASAAPAMAASDNVTEVKDGNATITEGSESTLAASSGPLKTLDVAGTLNVAKGDATAQTVKLTNTGKLNVASGSTLTVGSLEAVQGAVINVGNNTSKATLVANSADLKGGTLFLDPVWKDGNLVGDASQASIGGSNAAGGLLAVGQNSMLTLGSTSTTWLPDAVKATGGWGQYGTTAVLGVTNTQTLQGALSGGTTGITVDGTMTASAGAPTVTANLINFNANSLLVVDARARNLTNGVVFNATTTGVTANFADTSKVYLQNVVAAQTVSLVDGTNVTITDAALPKLANVSLADRVLAVGSVTTGGKINMEAAPTAAQVSARVPVSKGVAQMVSGLYGVKANDIDAAAADVRFVSRALNKGFTSSATQSAQVLEGAARIAVVGGSPIMTYETSQLGIQAAGERTSLLGPVGTAGKTKGSGSGAALKNGIGLWATPLYQYSHAEGLDAGKFNSGYTSNLGGGAFGGDYTFNDAFRVGMSFNVGGGTLKSNGDFEQTKNDFDFWGINAYGGWMQNNFSVSADVGYTGMSSDIKQDLPSSLGMGNNLKSDVDGYAITSGLRGEYKFETSVVDIMPHVGVRYTFVKTDSYDVDGNSGVGRLFKGDSFDQSIWTFPVGVTFSKDYGLQNSWYIKPKADLSIIPAAGDLDATSKVRMSHAGYTANVDTEIMDAISYQAGVGLEVGNNDMAFGLNYQFRASENTDNHGVQATFRYEF